MQKKPFSELGLSQGVLNAVSALGFEQATPIQTQAIPEILAGHDVVGQSQTGSGKTIAFAVPAVELADTKTPATQVLILCPTRELAIQVAEETAKVAAGKPGLRELPIYGGTGYDRQLRALDQGTHIVIGTPGRIMDHLERGSLDISALRLLVLDEADRMLDMGFLDDIRAILTTVPEQRQTVLFSATMPKPILEIVRQFTRDPRHIRIQSEQLTVPQIEQVYYEVTRRTKLDVLCRLIDLEEVSYAIIFCTTKMTVDDLTEHLLARGYAADKMHGDMSQPMRERVIARFRARKIEFLIATDVAARGLDVDDVAVVVNYDLPHDGEDYVHRIGRTGRAGRTGKAITLVAGGDIHKLTYIQRHTKARIQRLPVPTLEQVEQSRTDKIQRKILSTLDAGNYTRHDALLDQLLARGFTTADILSALVSLYALEILPPPNEATAAEPAGPIGQDKFTNDSGRNPQKWSRKNRAGSSKFPDKFKRKKPHPAERRIKKRIKNTV